MTGSSGSQASRAAVARAAATIKLRTARPADAPALAGLLGELGYPQAAAGLAPRIAALADTATDTVLVAEVGGQVVGLASLHVTPFFNEGQSRVGFSLDMQVDQHVREAILAQPEPAWTPAVDAAGQVRDGAEVCELTGRVDLHSWPAGTRAICRREDANPGAQLRFTDHDGHRFQVFLTDQPDPELAGLELRHRQRARVEDRIRAAKATGLQNLPFDRWRRNAVWLELILAAQDLTVWTQALLLDGALAVAEPKTLRYRLLHVAARVVRHARRMILRLQRTWPWAIELAAAVARLRALPLRC
jgi:hypothetical protein